jgi:hypothetical protein
LSDASRPDEAAVDLEDLAALGAGDLRAVLDEVGPERAVLALSEVDPALRRRLLTRWRPRPPRPEDQPPSADQVRSARAAVVEALCRLSRGGQIAFDPPDDILDQVA